MSYKKKAMKDTTTVFIMMAVAYFLGYVFRVILARELGVASYGLIYGVISLFGFFVILMNLGLETALVKYIAQYNVEKRFEEIKASIIIVLLIKLVLSMVVCGVLFIKAEWIALNYFGVPEACLLIQVFSVGMVFSVGITVLKSVFQGFQSMLYYSSIDVVKSVLVVTLTILLLSLGYREVAPIMAFTMVFIILPIIYAVPLIKTFPAFTTTKLRVSKAMVSKLCIFGVSMAFVGLADMVLSYTDTLMITYYRTLEEVGLYNVAVPSMKIIGIIGYVATAVVFPISSELWTNGKRKELFRGLQMLYKYVLVAVLPIALILFIFPETILGMLFGNEFRAAGNVLRVLVPGYFIYVYAGINTSMLSGIGQPKEVSKIMFAGAGANLLLNLWLIPLWGMEGAAVSTSIAFIIIFLLSRSKIMKYKNG